MTSTATQRRKARNPARKHGTASAAPATAATPATRWFLATDNEGHTYLAPVAERDKWDAWLGLPEGDERSWTPPDGGRQIDGVFLTFTDPHENGNPIPQ